MTQSNSIILQGTLLGDSKLSIKTDQLNLVTNGNYTAKIKERTTLTKTNEVDTVCHLVLDISKNGLKYKIGDAVRFTPKNPTWLVDLLSDKLHLNGNKDKVKQQLINEFEITSISRKTINKLAQISQNKDLNTLLVTENLKEVLSKANVLDIINDYNIDIDADTLLGILPQIKSRAYSIASSQLIHPEEIHLTIKTIRFDYNQTNHEGAGSVFANENLEIGSDLNFLIRGNKSFQLPADDNAPIIMIGVSTGIAPFRAMLQHIERNSSDRKAWMIYGNKKREKDYLYQNEMEDFHTKGVLNRIDTAFSRDNTPIKHVQDIISENKEEIISWLKDGAYIYICGSITMGKSVKETIAEITDNISLTPSHLMKLKRWIMDVY